jgi:hypothetical protein
MMMMFIGTGTSVAQHLRGGRAHENETSAKAQNRIARILYAPQRLY